MMNKIIFSLIVIFLMIVNVSHAEAKTLVAVFSRADENYSVGVIKEGNTMILAKMIAEKTGADLFEIKPAKPYPFDYDTTIDIAKKELAANARPEIAEDKDISEYDTIFLGYPIWWGDLPMACYTFLEAHDFSGKKIIPFCTHEGSGMSGTESKLKRVLKNAEFLKGLSMRGSKAQNSRDTAKTEINNWLNSLGF